MKRLAIILALLTGPPTCAQAAEKQPMSVETCVDGSGKTGALNACIGKLAKSCIGRDEAAAPPNRIISCLDGEQAQWDRLLNASYRALQKGLDASQQTKLREMQQSWIETRKRTCEFYEDYFQGSIANPMIANCMNVETARRAIYLDGFARDMASWKK
jgi:uncharacterized protein YecT (DUF1311 family)